MTRLRETMRALLSLVLCVLLAASASAQSFPSRPLRMIVPAPPAGITDLSAPILRGDTAVAALTCPFVHSNPLVMEMPGAVEHIRAAARQISAEIEHGELR